MLRRMHLALVTKRLVEYGLDISVRGNGTTDPPPGSYTYAEGTVVTVRAIPAVGNVFDHWELDGVFAGTSPTINVTMTAYHAVVAVFTVATYTVTVRVGAGGTTNPSPGSYSGYHYGDSFSVTAVPSSGYRFESWLVDGITYTINPLTVTVTKDLTITATFSPVPSSTLSGTVLDAEANAPIVGATVSLDTVVSATTGSDGGYSLTVSAGVYVLRVKAAGYQDYVETVDLSAGGTFTKDVRLFKAPQSVIQGSVKDAYGNPIPQATVTADGYTCTTDADGNFVLTVPPKVYVVTVSKSGWRTASQTVDASTAGTYPVSFTLTPAQSTIQGTVTDAATGEPIADAKITVNAFSTTSNSNGSFVLTVPPAVYEMTVEKEGYVTWKQTVDVSTPAPYIINVSLTKVAPSISPWLVVGLIGVAVAFLYVARRKG